jgi:hypothetical protein
LLLFLAAAIPLRMIAIEITVLPEKRQQIESRSGQRMYIKGGAANLDNNTLIKAA